MLIVKQSQRNDSNNENTGRPGFSLCVATSWSKMFRPLENSLGELQLKVTCVLTECRECQLAEDSERRNGAFTICNGTDVQREWKIVSTELPKTLI